MPSAAGVCARPLGSRLSSSSQSSAATWAPAKTALAAYTPATAFVTGNQRSVAHISHLLSMLPAPVVMKESAADAASPVGESHGRTCVHLRVRADGGQLNGCFTRSRQLKLPAGSAGRHWHWLAAHPMLARCCSNTNARIVPSAGGQAFRRQRHRYCITTGPHS